MPRNMRRNEQAKAAKGRRQYALDRNELRGPSEARRSASGPMSPAIKVNDDAALIEAFLQKREAGE